MAIGDWLKITCLKNLDSVCSSWRPTVVFSFMDPGTPLRNFMHYKPTHHFTYEFYDQEMSANPEAIRAIIESYFKDIKSLQIDQTTRILFHCHAGVSRSTACAYIFIHQHHRSNTGAQSFSDLMTLVNKPWPNYKICETADEILSLGGALTRPLTEYRNQFKKRLSAYRRLNRSRGLISPVNR